MEIIPDSVGNQSSLLKNERKKITHTHTQNKNNNK